MERKRLKLSDVMVAMRPCNSWVYLDLKTGRAAIRAECAEDMLNESYPYVKIRGRVDDSRFISLPAVSTDAFRVEFVRMQNFTDDTLREFGIPLALEMRVVLERDDRNKLKMPPDYEEYFGEVGIHELLRAVIMQREANSYADARLAGLARKWCNENGYEVEEDFLTYYENY